MDVLGTERSVRSFYHSWFADGTDWDEAGTSPFGPPPGFVPGGPNPSYRPDPAYGGPPIEPPMNQPVQKSFRDWNASWPENSWEVTENQCAYQAAVVKLIAAHVPAPAAGPLRADAPLALTECAGRALTIIGAISRGVPPYSPQWEHEGTPVTGAVTEAVTLDPLRTSDAGNWVLTVQDAAGGSAASPGTAVVVRTAPGSPGGSLRLHLEGAGVVLSWTAGADAEASGVLRCDASSGPCVPETWGVLRGTTVTDLGPPERVVWYAVDSRNGCGATP
jgi:hypothetical protein